MNFESNDTLSNGVKIPKVGLGTWFISDDQVAEAVRQAAAIGYRHIDTAQAYGNEAGVGAGVRSCGVPREEIFVTSKVRAEYKTYEAAAKSIDESLMKMGLSYIDMMIIHSPQPWVEVNQSVNHYFEENRQVWRALEAAGRPHRPHHHEVGEQVRKEYGRQPDHHPEAEGTQGGVLF